MTDFNRYKDVLYDNRHTASMRPMAMLSCFCYYVLNFAMHEVT